MSTASSEARDTQVLVFAKMTATAAVALVPFVIAKLLGKAEFGAVGGLWLIYGTLGSALTAGFPAAVLYYLADRERDARAVVARRLMGTVFVLGLLVGAVMYAIGAGGQDLLGELGAWASGAAADPLELSALRYFAWFAVLDVASRVFPNLLIAEKHARGAALFGVLRSLGMTIAQVLPASLGGGVQEIITGLTIYGAVQLLGMAWIIHRLYRGTQPRSPDPSVGAMIRFSFPLGITELVTVLNAQIDRYLVLLLMSGEAFAEYTAGAWQLPVVSIAYTMGQVYMPRFVRLLNAGRGAEVVEIWRASSLKGALVSVPICAAFFVGAEEFMSVGFREDYVVAAQVFRCYVVYTALRITPFGALILAAGRPRLVLLAAMFTLLSNLVISVPLALLIGFEGPALGTMLAFVPTILVYGYFIGRATGTSPWRTFPWLGWLRIALVALVGSLPAWALKLGLDLHPALALGLEAVLVVVGFVVVGRVTGTVTADDLREAGGWLRLRFFRRTTPPEA
ncbi:lipopolysaccharide biosynthesis protein [Paraliomyxa miuraensis]|uniref:lipopolysaccharide biosynthesis protein n=1 Tax=Paraliomyxa miuraensis TaxID=376150 RepID=UPI002256E511|nr:oligosaccharide flippase family protein [Paraliomyxa miuraensis]MCX4248060.1 oligosaccharide flippase family protein [Paraliomyxa miuraensis]